MRRKSWEHTTRDELNYLKKIGSSFRVSRNEGTLKLLNRYRSSVMDRTEWGDIKKEIVLDFVDKRIKELQELK